MDEIRITKANNGFVVYMGGAVGTFICKDAKELEPLIAAFLKTAPPKEPTVAD